MVQAGLDAVAMEVSSHALAMERVSGCEYDTAVFTNLTQDHLDYHRTMEDYFQAKLRLFADLTSSGQKSGPKRAIVNVDDPWGHRIRQACPVPVWTYSIRETSDIRAQDVRLSVSGTTFRVVTPRGECDIESRLVGEHNVYNVLAAIGVGLNEGLSLETIGAGILAGAKCARTFRARRSSGQDFTVVVDYARKGCPRAASVRCPRAQDGSHHYGVWVRWRSRPWEASENGTCGDRTQRRGHSHVG